MRKSLFAFLTMILMLGILAGCSDDTAAPKEEENKAEAKGDTEESEKQDKEDETGKEEAEEEEEKGTEAAEEGEEQKDSNKAGTPADVAGAVHFKEATICTQERCRPGMRSCKSSLSRWRRS